MKAQRGSMLVLAGMAVLLLAALACGGGTTTAVAPAPQPPAPAAQPAPAAPAPEPQAAPVVPPRAAPAPAATPTLVVPGRPAPKEEPVYGGVLRIDSRPTASWSFQDSLLNPTLGPEHSNESNILYQPLLQYDPYDNYRLKGALAEAWEIADTADAVTITLRADAAWADGRPVIAQDVKFTLDHLIKPPPKFTVTGLIRPVIRNINEVVVIDQKRVTIRFKTPDVGFLATLASPQLSIRPAHRTLEESIQDPMGSGAYLVKRVDTDVRFVFVRNEKFWEKDAQGRRLPYLDGIEAIIVSEELSVAAMFVGKIDMITSRAPVANAQAELRKRLPGGRFIERTGGNIGWGFRNVPPFDNPDVRRAMTLLSDRLHLLEFDFAGDGYIDGIGLWPASMPGSNWSLSSEEILSTPGWRYVHRVTGKLETDWNKLREGMTQVYQKDPADIALAKGLLKSAGFDVGQGQFPKMSFFTDNRYESRAVVIAESFRQNIGMVIPIDVVDVTTYEQRAMVRLDYPSAWVAPLTGLGANEPNFTLPFFTTDGGRQRDGFKVPELDALFAKQRQTVDPVRRKELVQEFQRKLMQGHHQVLMVNGAGPSGFIAERVRNPAKVQTGRTSERTNAFDRVWLAR